MSQFNEEASARWMISRAEYILANPDFRAIHEIEELESRAEMAMNAARHGHSWLEDEERNSEEMRDGKAAKRLLEDAAHRLRAQYFPTT